jgi:hypothetical protein
MRSAPPSVVPEEGRPVLGGKGPAAGEPGVETKWGERAGAPLREAIGMREGAPARVKQCKYQQIVANDLQSDLGGRAGAPQWSRNATRRARSLHGFATID